LYSLLPVSATGGHRWCLAAKSGNRGSFNHFTPGNIALRIAERVSLPAIDHDPLPCVVQWKSWRSWIRSIWPESMGFTGTQRLLEKVLEKLDKGRIKAWFENSATMPTHPVSLWTHRTAQISPPPANMDSGGEDRGGDTGTQKTVSQPCIDKQAPVA
jgi:hypothetical protein